MKKTDFSILIIFLILYSLLVFCNQNPYIDFIRFLVICLCFLPALHYGVPEAAFCTIISDGLLLFTPFYKIGVYFFCLVQLFYIHFFLHKKPSYYLFFLLLFFLVFPLPVIGAIYALLFFVHVNIAFFLWKQKKAQPYFGLYLLGLFFFICCDVLVAMGYFASPQPTLIWLFYAPSQLLLAFTAKELPPLPKLFAPYP